MNNTQCNVIANVQITITDQITKKQKRYNGKNRVTFNMLHGLGSYLLGSLLDAPDEYLKYTPRYVLFGTGTTEAQVSDTALVEPCDISRSAEVASPQRTSVIQGSTDSIGVTFHAYVPTSTYNPTLELSEVGLFSKTNLLLARVLVKDEEGNNSYIQQSNNTIIDVQWTITITSVGNE